LIKHKYNLLEVQPVDMFPHTYHIESVAKLVKRGSKVHVNPEPLNTGYNCNGH